jgi:hypothetical protein
MAANNEASTQPGPTFESKKSDDFTSRYANNVQFEPTLFDLKVIFGSTDLSATPPTVRQHTAIALSWAEVKVLAYFLQAHLVGHETQVGRIVLVPDVVLPPTEEIPATATPWQRAAWKKIFDATNKLYQEFMRKNPEALAPPKPTHDEN